MSPSTDDEYGPGKALDRSCSIANRYGHTVADMSTTSDPPDFRPLRTHFTKLVDQGLLPGVVISVAKPGSFAFEYAYGWSNLDAMTSMNANTLFRIYSMTKPFTAVALLALVEQGLLDLDSPICEHLPEFGEPEVLLESPAGISTRPAYHPITARHLLSHTSGLVSGFGTTIVDSRYSEQSLTVPQDWGGPLATYSVSVASNPLAFDPGTDWSYGISSDIAGQLIESVCKKCLATVFQEIIFDPLGLLDTGFVVSKEATPRLAASYTEDTFGHLVTLDPSGEASAFARPHSLTSGGGGLVSSLADYMRFATMLLNDGALDGARILAPASVASMHSSQLPHAMDLAKLGHSTFHGLSTVGAGFGLGGAIVLDPSQHCPGPSRGSYFWGGIAHTDFLIDWEMGIVAILLSQFSPSFLRFSRPRFWELVYGPLTSGRKNDGRVRSPSSVADEP